MKPAGKIGKTHSPESKLMLDQERTGRFSGRALPRSKALYDRATAVLPDGVTRVTIERDPIPFYIERGEGAYIVDVDGRRLLDLNNNFTTLIHGHGYAPVSEGVVEFLKTGTCFANPTQHEIALSELLAARIPGVERLRFVNSGTEAVMFAIKAARAFTGKSGVARIEGAYHGAYDWAEAGQNASPDAQNWPDHPIARPSYHGTPRTVAEDVVMFRFNDVDGVERQLVEAADRLACVLIDPMPSRAGLLHPDPEFIEAVEKTARRCGILVVADEVLNLRQAYTGASARYGLHPDLIAMGKIIGGGFPIGAIGGREEVMQVFGSTGRKTLLPQGGTFSANPVSMVAGRIAMEALTPEEFQRLERMGDHVRRELTATIQHHGAPFCVTGAASLFRIHPKASEPREYRDAYLNEAEAAVMKILGRYFLDAGVLLPFGAAACLSTPMRETDLDLITSAFAEFLKANDHLYKELGE